MSSFVLFSILRNLFYLILMDSSDLPFSVISYTPTHGRNVEYRSVVMQPGEGIPLAKKQRLQFA